MEVTLQFDSSTVSNFKLTIYENNLVFHRTLKNNFAFRVLISTKCMKFDRLNKKDMAFKLPSLYFNCIIWSTLSCFINGIFEPLSTLLPCPKCFGLVQIFCARPKIYWHIVAVTNILCQTKRWFAFSKIVFCAGTKVFEEALNAVKFLGWLKKFGPAQNILL